jgi:hypothetical protein
MDQDRVVIPENNEGAFADNDLQKKEMDEFTTVTVKTSAKLSSFDIISENIVGGHLFKKGRGKTFSMLKPWDMRYIEIDKQEGACYYYKEKKGYYIMLYNYVIHIYMVR